jgi:hypothetical protein
MTLWIGMFIFAQEDFLGSRLGSQTYIRPTYDHILDDLLCASLPHGACRSQVILAQQFASLSPRLRKMRAAHVNPC